VVHSLLVHAGHVGRGSGRLRGHVTHVNRAMPAQCVVGVLEATLATAFCADLAVTSQKKELKHARSANLAL